MRPKCRSLIGYCLYKLPSPLALIAGGKAVAAGALSGAAGYGVKRGLEAIEKKTRR